MEKLEFARRMFTIIYTGTTSTLLLNLVMRLVGNHSWRKLKGIQLLKVLHFKAILYCDWNCRNVELVMLQWSVLNYYFLQIFLTTHISSSNFKELEASWNKLFDNLVLGNDLRSIFVFKLYPFQNVVRTLVMYKLCGIDTFVWTCVRFSTHYVQHVSVSVYNVCRCPTVARSVTDVLTFNIQFPQINIKVSYSMSVHLKLNILSYYLKQLVVAHPFF